jgi:predicted transcriptional regulator
MIYCIQQDEEIPRKGGIVPDQRFNEEGRKYQIQKLWERQHEILGLALLGAEEKEIAQILDVTPATVSNCINSEIGKQQLAIMRGARDAETIDISKEIRNHAPKALQVLVHILENPNSDEKNLIKIATDMLDRAGYAAPKYVYGQFAHAVLTGGDIDELKERARMRRQLTNNTINAELIEGT